MNSTSDTMIFVTGMLFALTIMLCWKTKKVTDEVMKVLREKKYKNRVLNRTLSFEFIFERRLKT